MNDKPQPMRWDDRYAGDRYLFGTAPNDFLRDVISQVPAGRALCLADGEGRNGVFLAEQGFYDALAKHRKEEHLIKDELLIEIAQEVAKAMKEKTGLDWHRCDNKRARIRGVVRSVLTRYKYPPEEQKEAIELVLQQAERVM